MAQTNPGFVGDQSNPIRNQPLSIAVIGGNQTGNGHIPAITQEETSQQNEKVQARLPTEAWEFHSKFCT